MAIISLSLPAVFCLLGVAQALLLAIVLFTIRRGNRIANRLLGALVVTIAITVSASVLRDTDYFRVFPHLTRINHPFDFLGAPLLFLYIKALISQSKILEKKAYLHFLPAVACALFLTPYYLQSAAYKLAYHSSVQWYYYRSAFVLLQFLIYFGFMIAMLVRYSRKLNTRSGRSEKAVLFQVRFLIISFLSLWVIGILRYAIDLRYPAYIPQTVLILPVVATFVVYSLVYLSITTPEVLDADKDPAPERKYQKSTLTQERAERYLAKLRRAMDDEKLYTDGDLTLQSLAAKLGIPAQHLSQVVNEKLNQNILDFINLYRVEEAKRRLLDPARSHLTILSIAEEVGFNSKSSFNSVFKRYTNTTPSEFRRFGTKEITAEL